MVLEVKLKKESIMSPWLLLNILKDGGNMKSKAKSMGGKISLTH